MFIDATVRITHCVNLDWVEAWTTTVEAIGEGFG